MRDSVKEWIRQANEDLSTAQILLREKLYRPCCYHAQQALEKAMKGLLLQEGWELEKTHSIQQLLSFAKRFKLDFKIPEDLVTMIDSLYRGSNPPDEGLLLGGGPTEAQARAILSTVEEFFASHPS